MAMYERETLPQTKLQRQASAALGEDVRMWLLRQRRTHSWHDVETVLGSLIDPVPHRATLRLWVNEAKSYQ